MTLKERITEDMKAAMRASDKERLSTIRMVQAAIKQREVDERITLFLAELFGDLDPRATLDEINSRFLAVPYQGAYWADLAAA